MPVEAANIDFKLTTKSGSAGNSLASTGPEALGKFLATTAVSGALNELFGAVSGDANAAQAAAYRCVMVVNNHGSLAALTPVVLIGGLDATANAGTDVITCTGHNFTDGEAVRVEAELNTDVLPTGLAGSTTYFVRDVSGATFKLAATQGGAAIDITAAGGNFAVRRVPTAAYAIGVDPTAQSVVGSGSAQAVEIANEGVAPAGVTFSAVHTKAAGLSLGSQLDAGKCKALWIRQTGQNSGADDLDGIVLKVHWDTAA